MKNILKKFIDKKEEAKSKGLPDVESQIQTYKKAYLTQKDNERSYPAYIDLMINAGGSDDIIATLGAEMRYKDEKPTLVVTNSKGDVIFEEIRPEATQINIEEKLDDLETELECIEFILNEFKINDSVSNMSEDEKDNRETRLEELGLSEVTITNGMYQNLYKSDWELQRIALIRKIEHMESGNCKYVINRGGKPHYTFELLGYFKLPIAKYDNTGMIKIPSTEQIDNLKVMTKIEFEQNQEDETSLSKFAMGIIWIVMIVGLLGSFYLNYKSSDNIVTSNENNALIAKGVMDLVDIQTKLIIQPTNESIDVEVIQ